MFSEGEEDVKDILRGEIQEFLNEFETSEETEDDMKTLLPIWRNELLNHAREVGGESAISNQNLNECL
ncbi:MAG: hypothetical protein KDK69_03855 [Chlamydiia bacterium]|nr:hypothetical protein [Chlamydiia bacterium]